MEGKGKEKARRSFEETLSPSASKKKSPSKSGTAQPQKGATAANSKLGLKRKSTDEEGPNGSRDKNVLGKKRPADSGPSGSTRDGGGGSGGQRKGQVKLKAGSPWSIAWKGRERSEAVLDGLQRVFRRAQSDEGSVGQREKLVEGLLLVARVTAEPIREQALKYVDAAADRWKQSCLTRAWRAGGEPTPSEILHVLPRLYHMERVGVHHDLKPQVQTYMHTTGYTAKDYLGWDPVTEAPPDNTLHSQKAPGVLLSRYEVLSVSVRHAFFAARLGLSLGGCGFMDVLRWVPKMRPYKGPLELDAEVYRAQCELIVSVVQALSDLGELRLPGSLMPHEFLFVREHLGGLLKRREIALAAQFLEVLHVFGSDGGDEVCECGLAYLLATMGPSGSWTKALAALGTQHDNHDADLHAIKALLVHSPRGYGPGIPGLVPQLLAWQASDADPDAADFSDLPPEPAHMLDVPMCPNGDYDLRLRDMEKLVQDMEAADKKKADKAARPQAEEGPVRDRVLKIGRDLETAKEANDWRNVFEGLKALRKDKAIDKSVLGDTGIGRVVNKLRKAANPQVAGMAQKVVNQWKQMLEGNTTKAPDAPAAP